LRIAGAGRQSREVPKAQRRPPPIPRDELFTRCLSALGCGREELRNRTRLLTDERRAVAHLRRWRSLLRLAKIGELLGVGEGQASRLASEGADVLSENFDLRPRLKCVSEDEIQPDGR